MSWDALNGIRDGERQAKASERAKHRGAALARSSGSGKSGKSKSVFTRAQGRAAVARGGRGIVVKSLKNGGSFKDVLNYADDPAKSAKFVAGNCPDSKSALRTMLAASRLRPDIKNPVGHITLSLPPCVGKDEKRFGEFVEELRSQIGLDESFPFIAIQHFDQAHPHAHLVFSRLSLAGVCHDQRNIGLRCAAAEQHIEQKFNLHIVPRAEFRNTNTNLKKAEIEKSLRLKKLPERLQIQRALDVALEDRPTVQQFVQRLQAAGIVVKANVASTGKMNGFSFQFEGLAFGASKIGKQYSWKSLQEKIDGIENIDIEYLRSVDGSPCTPDLGITKANSEIFRFVTAASQIPAEADRGVETTEQGTIPTPSGNRAAPVEATLPAAVAKTPAKTPATTATKNNVAEVHGLAGRVTITPPDLRAERWSRSAQLLAEFRRGLKSKIEIAELDKLASECGHDPADIVSVHATALDKLPGEVAQDVLENVQSQELRDYIEREFVSAKNREVRQREELSRKNVNSNLPGYRPGGL